MQIILTNVALQVGKSHKFKDFLQSSMFLRINSPRVLSTIKTMSEYIWVENVINETKCSVVLTVLAFSA